jgi:hypothetical protein
MSNYKKELKGDIDRLGIVRVDTMEAKHRLNNILMSLKELYNSLPDPKSVYVLSRFNGVSYNIVGTYPSLESVYRNLQVNWTLIGFSSLALDDLRYFEYDNTKYAISRREFYE